MPHSYLSRHYYSPRTCLNIHTHTHKHVRIYYIYIPPRVHTYLIVRTHTYVQTKYIQVVTLHFCFITLTLKKLVARLGTLVILRQRNRVTFDYGSRQLVSEMESRDAGTSFINARV